MVMWMRLPRPPQRSSFDDKKRSRSAVAITLSAAANRTVSCCFLLCWVLLSSLVTHTTAGNSNASSPPWQRSTSTLLRNDNTNVDDEDDENYEGIVTRFAPGGRVIAVEKAMRDVMAHPLSSTAVAIVCRDGTVVVSTLPSSPYLYLDDNNTDNAAITTTTTATTNSATAVVSLWLVDSADHRVGVSPTAMAPFLRIPTNTLLHPSSSPILVVTVGNPIHSQLMRHRVAALVETKFDRDCSVAGWARRCADQCQVLTQRSGGGNQNDDNNNNNNEEQSDPGTLLPVSLLLLDADSLWRVDPSGQFWKFRALALGRHSARAEVLLREKLAQAAGGGSCINREAVVVDDADATTSIGQSPAKRMSEIRDWIAHHLSLEEALRIATECVLEAYENVNIDNNNKPTRDRASTTDRTMNPTTSKIQLRGITISPSNNLPRMRCFTGKELRSLMVRDS